MTRLEPDNLHCIWAGVTMAWDEHDRFDEKTYAASIERTIARRFSATRSSKSSPGRAAVT